MWKVATVALMPDADADSASDADVDVDGRSVVVSPFIFRSLWLTFTYE